MSKHKRLNDAEAEKLYNLCKSKIDAGFPTPPDDLLDTLFRLIEEWPDIIGRCRAATQLSRIVKKGLGVRTKAWLDSHPKADDRVIELLSSSILRMEGH